MAAISPLEVVILERPKLTLFEIVDHLTALYDTRDMMDESDREEINAEIAAFEQAEISKVDGITRYLAHCESQQSFAQEEIKRLQSRKQLWAHRQERLELVIKRVMEGAGKTQLEGRTSTLSLKKCPASVEVLDQNDVPVEYIRTKLEQSVDKVSAKLALQSGVEIPGLLLITDRKSVVRK